jgi:multidrug efflux pump subunit AcrA (membrane-fusion protein)
MADAVEAVQTPEYRMNSLNALSNTPVGGQPVPGMLSNVATFKRDQITTNSNQTNIQPVFDVAPGVDAVVHVPETPDRSFPGKVTRIASALQPGSRTLLTEIDVPNPDGAISSGIYCSVELHIPRRTPSLVVPADAVVFDQDGLHVAAVANRTVHLQKILIARDFGEEVEVREGVKPDDQVIPTR